MLFKEEEYLTCLVKLKVAESDDKETLICKTAAGKDLVFQKIIIPDIPSANASSPRKHERSRIIEKVRAKVSGNTTPDKRKQMATEIKRMKRKGLDEIFKEAGLKPSQIDAKTASQIRSLLQLSWAKARIFRRWAKAQGIKIASEKLERKFQKTAVLGKVKVVNRAVFVKTGQTNEERLTMVPVSYIEDLNDFVARLLDEYKNKRFLTWHNGKIPKDEIHIKIGGDHGGGTFKMSLQIANLKFPNSKRNTHLILMVKCKDSYRNLSRLMLSMDRQIQELKRMRWRGKSVTVILFGDYKYELETFGLSSAASCHPCLFCTIDKDQIQDAPERRGGTETIRPRTLDTIKESNERFEEAGAVLKSAKHFNNTINKPLLDVPLENVCPPYLHVMLGLVNLHLQELLKESYYLDKQIALDLAKDRNWLKIGDKFTSLSADFQDTVKRLEGVYRAGRQPNAQTQPFEMWAGPVVSNIDTVLKSHHIYLQQYHGGVMNGNQCANYIYLFTREAVANSVEAMTFSLTEDRALQRLATTMKEKYTTLNSLYRNVHTRVSHARPVEASDLPDIQEDIDNYMKFFRANFSQIQGADVRVLPKHHLLESHVIPWMRKWGFGMGFHGEQGGEQIHAVMNKLKARTTGVLLESEQLRIAMTEQLKDASPVLLSTPEK